MGGYAGAEGGEQPAEERADFVEERLVFLIRGVVWLRASTSSWSSETSSGRRSIG